MLGVGVSHLLQLITGLVINSSVTTSPTLAGERMLLIPKVSILSEHRSNFIEIYTIFKYILNKDDFHNFSSLRQL